MKAAPPLKPATSVWRSNWKHLRVPFQLTLAPIFLWGWFLSGTTVEWHLLPAFVSFHFLLYTGITAFNSFYDRDTGPIGGLEEPPAVQSSLLPLALALKACGFLLALPLGVPFAGIYCAFVLLSVLYSHPRTRWKAHPLLSALTVCLGQGLLGFLAGWAAARGGLGASMSVPGVLGMVSAALTTLGMYPVTQVYQVEEDGRRGDRTLCVTMGVDRALRFSQVCFALAGVAACGLAAVRFTAVDATLLTAAYLFLLWHVGQFRHEYASLRGSEAFRRVLLLNYTASAGFLLFICVRLAARG